MRAVLYFLIALALTACSGFGGDGGDRGGSSRLSTSVSRLDLGGEPTGSMELAAGGSWRAEVSASWLEVSPSAGSSGSVVSVHADRSGLEPGRHTATIEFVSGSSRTPVEVSVRFPTITFHALRSAESYEQAGALGLSGFPSEPAPPDGETEYHPNRVLVTLEGPVGEGGPHARAERLREVAAEHGGRVAAWAGVGGRTVATLHLPDPAKAALSRLARDPRIQSVHPVPRITMLETDPLMSQQAWHYDQIRLAEAWDLGLGSEAVTVAVIDSGFDTHHEDLVANLMPGYDFGEGDDDPHARTGECGHHGTHVSGTLAAAANGVGGVGVAPGVRILPLKVGAFEASSGDCKIWVDDVLYAILHAAGSSEVAGVQPLDSPVDVMNLSLGSPTPNDLLQEALEYAASRGVTVVAASGNLGTRGVYYPAAYPEAIAVGATDARGKRATYSNYGPELELAAPGGNTAADANWDGVPDGITSTVWSVSGNGYGQMQGTSMAAPHVSGVVALMKSANGGLGASEIRHLLTSTALDASDEGWDEETGAGIVDALAAVRAAEAYVASQELHATLYLQGEGEYRQLWRKIGQESPLTQQQAEFGSYRIEIGVDGDGDGVVGEAGEWFGSVEFSLGPDEGDREVVVPLSFR